MNLNNYTIKSQEALQQAQLITQTYGNQFIENEHILKAIFETQYSDLVKKNGVATVDAVEVKEIGREPIKSYMPAHPAADKAGYIYKAAVNVDEEMVDMMEASRQYQNNVEVITTLRALTMRTINIGK